MKEEPGYAPALVSMLLIIRRPDRIVCIGCNDTILLNDNVLSDTKMQIMRQLILQSEQGTKDSTQIVSLFQNILKAAAAKCRSGNVVCTVFADKKWRKGRSGIAPNIKTDPENKPTTSSVAELCYT